MRIIFVVSLLFLVESAPFQDPTGVEALFQIRFAELWRAGDAAGLAELWVEDGDWSNVVGSRRVQRGREAIAAVWRTGLEGRNTAAEREIEVRVDAVRRLSDSRALVDLLMSFSGRGGTRLDEAMVAIVERQEGSWQIVSARVARVPR